MAKFEAYVVHGENLGYIWDFGPYVRKYYTEAEAITAAKRRLRNPAEYEVTVYRVDKNGNYVGTAFHQSKVKL